MVREEESRIFHLKAAYRAVVARLYLFFFFLPVEDVLRVLCPGLGWTSLAYGLLTLY
jgi:hypothetical protein